MIRFRHLAPLILGSGLLLPSAWAQGPAGGYGGGPEVSPGQQPSAPSGASAPYPRYRYRRTPYLFGQGGSSRYVDTFDQSWAQHNMEGGYQNENAQTPVATFDTGPDNRQEQLQAESVGISRANMLRSERTSSMMYGPHWGFGWGFR